MKCPNCNTTDIPEDAKFCPNCGSVLKGWWPNDLLEIYEQLLPIHQKEFDYHIFDNSEHLVKYLEECE